MTRFKKIGLFSLAALLIITIAGFIFLSLADNNKATDRNQHNQTVLSDILHNRPKQFFITAWNSPTLYSGNFPNFKMLPQATINDNFKVAKSAGLDALIETFPLSFADNVKLGRLPTSDQSFMQALNASNLSAIVTEPTFEARFHFSPLAKNDYSFSNNSAILGVRGYDEPGVPAFEKIAASKKAFLERFPDKFYYVNILGSTAPSSALYLGGDNTGNATYSGAPISYEEYVSQYMKTVHPQLLSFDHYPFMATGTDPTYLSNLSYLASVAQKANIPLWSFIQDEGFPYHRAPNLTDIKWEVATNLAFGVSGIEYFAYDAENQKGFTPAMVANGKKTPIFYDIQKVNQELRSFQSAFFAYKWQSAVAIQPDTDKNATTTEMIRDLQQSSTSISGISSYQFKNASLIGTFSADSNKKQKAYLVSNIEETDNQVTLHFEKSTRCTLYLGGKKQEITLKNQTLTFKLPAGEAAFVTPE